MLSIEQILEVVPLQAGKKAENRREEKQSPWPVSFGTRSVVLGERIQECDS